AGGGSPAPTVSHPPPAPIAHVLYELDPQTGAVVAEVPIGHPAPPEDVNGPGADRHGITTGQGSVWVTNQGDDTVTRIDAASHRIQTKIGVTSPNAVAVGADTVWIANDDGAITSIDPGSGAATRIALPGTLNEP